MSHARFVVDMKMNLFCHFMVCADVHKYVKNRYYRQENYSLFDEDAYCFFREDLPVYCLELLLKIVSDHPQFDVDCIQQSLDSYFFSFLDKRTREYLEFWKNRESRLLTLKRRLEKEWPPMEQKLLPAIEQIFGEKLPSGGLRIFLIDAYYGRREGEGMSSTAEVNMVDQSMLLICACEPEEVAEIFRIIVHEIIHKPLGRIIGQLAEEIKLSTNETNIVSETYARLIEKQVCSRLDIPSMTEEEIRENTERFGFLEFYLQAASNWQDYIKGTTRCSLKAFMESQVELNREVLQGCEYSSSFL